MRKLLVATLLIIGSELIAQNECNITTSYNQPLKEVLNDLEQKSSARIYFKDEWVHEVEINQSFENACIEDILTQLLNPLDIFFTRIDDSYILSKDYPFLEVSDAFLVENAESETEQNPTVPIYQDELANAQAYIKVGKRSQIQSNEVNINGRVLDAKSNDPLIGAVLFSENKDVSAITDGSGRFTLSVPVGELTLTARHTSSHEKVLKLLVFSDDSLNVMLDEKVTTLQEVVVTSSKDRFVADPEMGVERIDIEALKTVPKVLGENDIIRTAMLLPGVTSAGEASQGFNVRGGNVDQNMVLFNHQPVYNTSHFFGFFSVFNEDFVASSTLYKGHIPAKFGGRLSSVLDIKSKVSSDTIFNGKGGISPVTSRVSFGLPLITNKLSLNAGVRTTYANWVLDAIDNREVQNSNASFFDVVARLKYSLNENDYLILSGYRSKDKFNLLSDSLFAYANTQLGMEWLNHINGKFQYSVLAGVSKYNYQISYDENPAEAADVFFGLSDYNLKINFDQELNNDISLTYGIDAKYLEVAPGEKRKLGEGSNAQNIQLQKEKAIESGAYFEAELRSIPDIIFTAGLRYSMFNNLGPKRSLVFHSQAREVVIDTVDLNGSFQQYGGPEWRISSSYQLTPSSSVKVSYLRTRQYLNTLSNTTSPAPIDIWKLSDEYLEPQISDQVSLGLYKTLAQNRFEASVELFYKKQSNLYDYKIGAQFILNESIASDVLQGDGQSYGVEVLFRKSTGRLSGWFSYTYSRSFMKVAGSTLAQTINNGKKYPTNFDRPHNFNLISNYKINNRVSTSLNVSFVSGRPVTVPLASVEVNSQTFVVYSDRNTFRIPNYFRVDLGISLEGNHKKHKRVHGYWSFSVYNLLGRDNAYSLFFKENNSSDSIDGFQLSIFDNPVPTVTYNFKF